MSTMPARMSRTYAMAYLSTHGLSPPDAVSLAAKLGYDGVGLRIVANGIGGAFAPLMQNAALLRETLQRVADTGVFISDVEIIRIGADFKVADTAQFLDTCAALGARAVLVAGDDPDISRLTHSYATFCAAAARHNLTADLEFMPWTAVRDCATAWRIVEAAAQPNGAVIVDALHWARSGSTLADISAIPRHHLNYAQICDGAAKVPATEAELIHDARCARLQPGDGGIDLVSLFAVLPDDLQITIEVPNDSCVALVGVEAWGRQSLAMARAVIARSDDLREAHAYLSLQRCKVCPGPKPSQRPAS